MRAVNMRWRGKDYTIPATKAFQIGEQIEDIVTIAEISQWATKPKMHKLARCYATMLRFAGCKVADATVFDEIMGAQADADGNMAAAQAIGALAELLTGGSPDGDGDPAEKTSAS